MADVHLGARHNDLGPAAAALRERQFAAFHAAIELAIAEKVDLVLIAGDLFDSNSQPRRSVERAAAELGRLVERHVPVVLIPGTHDCYDASSIYRVFDLPRLAGAGQGNGDLVVLTDSRPQVTFSALDLTVHGRVASTKRAPASPLAGFRAAAAAGEGLEAAHWQVGMIHGALRIPGVIEDDDVIFTEQEIAASGLHYLALGHWHSFKEGRANGTAWAYPGAPEPVALDQDGAGQVLLVTLAERDGNPEVTIEPRTVGRSRVKRLELDAATVPSQADIVRQLTAMADPDLVLDVRLVGVRPDALDLNLDEVEQQLAQLFLRLRVRDSSVPALPEGLIAPADTIAGAFVLDLERRIAEHEGRGEHERANELREALRLGRLLLEAPERMTLA
jgi:DNA repair exonuclease SbcCD nuclease subunit